jgi:hypothetical protein
MIKLKFYFLTMLVLNIKRRVKNMFKKILLFVICIAIAGLCYGDYCAVCSNTGYVECLNCRGTGCGSECFTCEGSGIVQKECIMCQGNGRTGTGMKCLQCKGSGFKIEKCSYCRGTGCSSKCFACNGRGVKVCQYCKNK